MGCCQREVWLPSCQAAIKDDQRRQAQWRGTRYGLPVGEDHLGVSAPWFEAEPSSCPMSNISGR